jgi:hypothetical protein
MLFIFGVYLDFCVDLPLYVNLCQGGGGGGGGKGLAAVGVASLRFWTNLT